LNGRLRTGETVLRPGSTRADPFYSKPQAGHCGILRAPSGESVPRNEHSF